MKPIVNNSFIIFSVGVVAMFLLPSLFEEGMFMDGLIYTTVAHNMYLGIGDLWHPMYSETLMHDFLEHPPLAMWLQSLLYNVFGDSVMVDKLYSFFMAILNFVGLSIFWRHSMTQDKRNLFWWPVLLFILVPSISWAFTNNMLENTMGLFSLMATFLLFKSVNKSTSNQLLLITGAGVLVIISFLSKGFPGLYPLGFFVVYFAVYHSTYSFKQMIGNSVALVVLFTAIFGLFLYLNEPALDQLTAYFTNQVVSSLAGDRVVGSRFHIVEVFFSKLIIPFLVAALVTFFWYRKFKLDIFKNASTNKLALLFFLIGISASAPIMISPKQLGFYIVPSVPFFVLSMAVLTASPVSSLIGLISPVSRGFRLFSVSSVLLSIAAIALMFQGIGGYSREKELIHDIDLIRDNIPHNVMIGISEKEYDWWSLRSYFQRKYQVALTKDSSNVEYLILHKNLPRPHGYVEVKLPTSAINLFQAAPTP